MLVLLGALWALWGACWLRRVELRRENEELVRALGLEWAPEGLGPSVRAMGSVKGRPVELRWRRWVRQQAPRAALDHRSVGLDEIATLAVRA